MRAIRMKQTGYTMQQIHYDRNGIHPTFEADMSIHKKNKELVINLINELNGVKKEREKMEPFISDESLITLFLFLDNLFPGNRLLIDELTAEGSRVILRLRLQGSHEGWNKNIPAVKEIEFLMVLGFGIMQGKIFSHWLIADQAKLMEQLEN